MTHSTDTQSFNYFVDFTGTVNGIKLELEIPVKDMFKQAVASGALEFGGIPVAENLISDYLSDNCEANIAIGQYLNYFFDGGNCEESYTVRKVPV